MPRKLRCNFNAISTAKCGPASFSRVRRQTINDGGLCNNWEGPRSIGPFVTAPQRGRGNGHRDSPARETDPVNPIDDSAAAAPARAFQRSSENSQLPARKPAKHQNAKLDCPQLAAGFKVRLMPSEEYVTLEYINLLIPRKVPYPFLRFESSLQLGSEIF